MMRKVDPTDVFNIVRDRTRPTVEVVEDATTHRRFRTPVVMYPDTNIKDDDFLDEFNCYDFSNKLVLVVWEDEAARDAAIVKLQSMQEFEEVSVSQEPISKVIQVFPCLGHVDAPLPDYPTAITPSVYISGELPASQWTTFDDLGIKSVLNVTDDVKNFFEEQGIRYHNIRIEDSEKVVILPYLPEACDFIRDSQDEGGKVLVHCAHGRSRSVSMVLAYLIRDRPMSLAQAKELVGARRREARENAGFHLDLETWENQCISE